MDDLFVEVHKRQGKKLSEFDPVRFGRRGSGTVFGLKQLFAGFRNPDTHSSPAKPLKQEVDVGVNTEGANLCPENLLGRGVSISRVDQKLPLIVVDRPYDSTTNVQESCLHSILVPLTFSTPLSCRKFIHVEEMKKVPTDPRIAVKHRVPSSNTRWFISDEYLGLPSSGGVLNHAATADTPLSNLHSDNAVSDVCDWSFTQKPTADELAAGDFANELHSDETDSHKIIDHLRTREAIEHYKKKISRIMQAIKAENQAKEENVSEYLQLSAAAADKIQLMRIKAIFEKKNQKSTHLVAQLQRKLELSMQRLREVETHGVLSSSRQGKGVLKDVGHGIKTIVSKPKEFAHLLRNKFGSADNISGLECLENDQSSQEGHPVHRGNNILRSHFKSHSTENMITYDSETSTMLFHAAESNDRHSVPVYGHDAASHEGLCLAMNQLERSSSALSQLQNCISELQCQLEDKHVSFKQALEEEKVRRERLQEQFNDLVELHLNEVTNLKQELSSVEEKMEYQLEDRTRDLQDLLESCQTKIQKMDLQQQQQQQLISMESFDNSTVRTLVTKLINVVLALLAVVLVLINTATNLLQPFVSTRVRCFATIVGAAAFAIIWRSFDRVSDASSTAGSERCDLILM